MLLHMCVILLTGVSASGSRGLYPLGRHPRQTHPVDMTIEVGFVHPTGLHSCYLGSFTLYTCNFVRLLIQTIAAPVNVERGCNLACRPKTDFRPEKYVLVDVSITCETSIMNPNFAKTLCITAFLFQHSGKFDTWCNFFETDKCVV